MSSSFDLPSPEHFTAGTVGEPGRRVFYLQAGGPGEIVTLRLEKTQVGALAEYLAGLLADLPAVEPVDLPARDLDLIEPVQDAWVVGTIGVAYDEDADRVVLVVEELAEEEDAEKATARFRITRGQAAAFVEHARELVAAGRPPCPFCGRPLDPEGHVCPRSNGHLAS